MFTSLVVSFLNILRKFFGHALLAPEEMQEEMRKSARQREQDRIMESDVSTEDTAKDLEEGRF